MSLHNVKVLLVEDNLDASSMLTAVLSAYGCEVATASDGIEALRVLDETAPDVVVADVIMPGMSGIGLASQIDAVRPDLPVVLMTGHVDLVSAIVEKGAVALLKPFEPSALLRVIEDQLHVGRTANRA